MDTLTPFLLVLGLALLFWVAVIRPQMRRQRTVGQMQRELAVGDEVMLTSGIIGVLRSLDDKTVQIEVSDGVCLRVARAAIGQVTEPVARDTTALETESQGPADEPEES